MRGSRQQLLASETTRQGFAGTRFLVERIAPSEASKSCRTPNRDEANAQWHRWRKEWNEQPGGFGGAFGDGIGGKLPG
jgi:hypothetical protein